MGEKIAKSIQAVTWTIYCFRNGLIARVAVKKPFCGKDNGSKTAEVRQITQELT